MRRSAARTSKGGGDEREKVVTCSAGTISDFFSFGFRRPLGDTLKDDESEADLRPETPEGTGESTMLLLL